MCNKMWSKLSMEMSEKEKRDIETEKRKRKKEVASSRDIAEDKEPSEAQDPYLASLQSLERGFLQH